MSIKATRLTARVAPYREAIAKARKAGLTWGDIGDALGVQSADRLRWAYAHCGRYEADQVDLPEPKSEPKAKPAGPPTHTNTDRRSTGGFIDITPKD